MSTGLTPEQRVAAEATLRQWRRAERDIVLPCHYCGTPVLLQDAEPVPDNPADPYDRWACTACSAEGLGRKRAPEGSARRRRARQIRARIMALAQEYREACRQHEEIAAYVFRLNGEAPEVLLKEEERVWEAMEQRRAALFGALEELGRLEGEGR